VAEGGRDYVALALLEAGMVVQAPPSSESL
jgi:hypothetical protein